MYYHASQTKGVKVLEPRISNHGVPLIYFSKKRENVLVYLSNAVEKYCKETGFQHSGKWTKWGPYGFTENGIQYIDEYYPSALIDTYKGVSGYIYEAKEIVDSGFETDIRDAETSSASVVVTNCEFIPDAYEAILDAEQRGLLLIKRYEDYRESVLEFNKSFIKGLYQESFNKPDLQHFFEGKCPYVKSEI